MVVVVVVVVEVRVVVVVVVVVVVAAPYLRDPFLPKTTAAKQIMMLNAATKREMSPPTFRESSVSCDREAWSSTLMC